MKQENKFYVGQDVYYIPKGWCVVTEFDTSKIYPVKVKSLEGIECVLRIDGTQYGDDKYPSLYTYDPINNTKPPKRVEYIDYLGIKIPAPETEYPEEDTEYYYRGCEGMVENNIWAYWAVDKERFKYGIWLDEDLAKEAIEKINSVLCISK